MADEAYSPSQPTCVGLQGDSDDDDSLCHVISKVTRELRADKASNLPEDEAYSTNKDTKKPSVNICIDSYSSDFVIGAPFHPVSMPLNESKANIPHPHFLFSNMPVPVLGSKLPLHPPPPPPSISSMSQSTSQNREYFSNKYGQVSSWNDISHVTSHTSTNSLISLTPSSTSSAIYPPLHSYNRDMNQHDTGTKLRVLPPPPPPGLPFPNSQNHLFNLLKQGDAKFSSVTHSQPAKLADSLPPPPPPASINDLLQSAAARIIEQLKSNNASSVRSNRNSSEVNDKVSYTYKDKESHQMDKHKIVPDAHFVRRTQRSQFSSKREWQERIAFEFKKALKPYFKSKTITKEQYKDIMRESVKKIFSSDTSEVTAKKFEQFAANSVQKILKSASR